MLQICNLSASAGKKQILKGLNFSVSPEKITVILGKNGSGKSTLVRCINRLQNYQGEIFLQKKNLKDMPLSMRAREVSVLPQELANPHILVEDLVAMGRNPYVGLQGKYTSQDMEWVEYAIEFMEIKKLRSRYVNELSGGERQKVYLAANIAQDTPMMVLDEPTTYLDLSYEKGLLKKLEQLKRQQHKTLVVVMHNLSAAIELADEVLLLDDGMQAFFGNKEQCLQEKKIEEIFGVERNCVNERIFFG